MSVILYSLLGFLAAIAILVTVHEYGHFQVARACGVKVLKFSIGFGRPLITWRRKNDPTAYCIGCIPLGGYVKMLERAWGQHQFYLIHQAMKGNSVDFEVAAEGGGARSIAVDFAAFDQYAIGSLPVPMQLGMHPPAPPAAVYRLVPGAPAARAGLQPGDLITAIDGAPIGDWADLVAQVSARPGQALALTVRRGGGLLDLALTTESARLGGRTVGRIGLYRPPPETIKLRYGPLAAIPAALDYNWRMTVVTLRSLGRMLSARMSSDNLSGPITIARLAGHTIESGVDDFLKFLAIISISLGLINLLPIPLLDGGHLLYFAVEAVKGSPPSPRAMLWGQQLGIALLVLLMGVAFYNDIMRLF